MTIPNFRRTHTSAACTRLLTGFMIDVGELRDLTRGLAEVGGAGAAEPRDDRPAVERLTSSLWGVFSHHRAVVDAEGTFYDLGSWRTAAELIAEVANCHYGHVSPPIRYMDCYMGVLLGEERRVEARPLHRWIFEQLHRSGCDWIYSFTPNMAEEDRRSRQRELAAAIARAYDDDVSGRSYAPVPAVVAAYQDVYGRLPDGWPHV